MLRQPCITFGSEYGTPPCALEVVGVNNRANVTLAVIALKPMNRFRMDMSFPLY